MSTANSQSSMANYNKESECQVNDNQLLFLSSLQRREQLLVSCLQLLLKRSGLVFELLSVILHRRTCAVSCHRQFDNKTPWPTS